MRIIEEILEGAGYDLHNPRDAEAILGMDSDWLELRERLEALLDKYQDYKDFIETQEDEFGIYDNPTFEEWQKNGN